jgi:steroid delta-isomerase-like uncharacterized protein
MLKITAIIASGLLLSTSPLSAQLTTREVVESFLQAWNDHDADGVGALCDPAAQYTEVATGSVFHGPEGCARYARETFAGAPDFKLEWAEVMVDGGLASVEWVMSGTHTGDWTGLPATGREFSIAGVSVFRIEQSRIVRVADYWDLYTLLVQLGILSTPDAQDSPG